MYILLIWYWALLAASEATKASKQPRRSKPSLQVKLVTPIYYVNKFQGTFVSQKMTLLDGDKHGPLTCVAIAAGNNSAKIFNFMKWERHPTWRFKLK